MPVPLTEEETQNRQKALMEYLAKQAKEKNIDIPEADMGSFLGDIPGLDKQVQDALAAYQSGDTLGGGSGNDTLGGGSGNDTLDSGTAGVNTLTTTSEQVLNIPGVGNVTIPAGLGGDVITTTNGGGDDGIDRNPSWGITDRIDNGDGTFTIIETDQNPNSPTYGSTNEYQQGEKHDTTANWVDNGDGTSTDTNPHSPTYGNKKNNETPNTEPNWVDNGDGTSTDTNPNSPTYGNKKNNKTTDVKDTTHVRYKFDDANNGFSADFKTYVRHSLNAAGEIISTDYPNNPAYYQPADNKVVAINGDGVRTIEIYNKYGVVIDTKYMDSNNNLVDASQVTATSTDPNDKVWYLDENNAYNVVETTRGAAPEGVVIFESKELADSASASASREETTKKPVWFLDENGIAMMAESMDAVPPGFTIYSTKAEAEAARGTEIVWYINADGNVVSASAADAPEGVIVYTTEALAQAAKDASSETEGDGTGGDGTGGDRTENQTTGVFDINDPRSFTGQQAIDPLIAERGIQTYTDQEFTEDEKLTGKLNEQQSAFLGQQQDITAETAGKPIYDANGNIIGYTQQGAQGPARQKPMYDTEGNIVGFTEGMQAATYDADQLGLPIYNDQGQITGYTGQLKTTGATSVGDEGKATLTKEVTAPTGPIDPETGLPTQPAPVAGALITAEEAATIAANTDIVKYEIDAEDLPNRAGMISDEVTIVYDDNGQIIGAIPAGAELPTAATVQQLGREAFDLLADADIPTATYTKAEDTDREQEDVTTQELVAAQTGYTAEQLKGSGIIAEAIGKKTSDLDQTELEAAPAVAATADTLEEMFPEYIKGEVQALDTVRGQLASMMADFDDGQTPDWAAGSIRVANQLMAERGLGNSSIAAATIVQAAQEAALPIATADAQVYANMNLTNLSNQNKFALDNAAAARNFELSDLSNEQQVALANSAQRYTLLGTSLTNTQAAMLANAQMQNALQEQDLSRSQQEQIANAARYAELENLNLTHEQQTRLTNATNEMQVNLANLSTKEKAVLAELQVQAALEGQELDNIQQTNAIKAARYAEANNLDFTAEQNRVFSNSKMVETLALDNLEFEQTRTLSNAANYAQMDLANLNNRQTALVENARNFLQMDLANLSNTQQAAILDAQGLQQFMLSDQAAENAALQFNATSQNQVDQFYENLTTDVNKFNANLMAAMEQYNAGQVNAMAQFNATMDNQREQFNANNALEIEQANVNYRRELNTINTAGENAVAQINAQNYFNVSQQAMANIWQDYRDTMAYAFTQAQNDKDRAFNLAVATMQREHENDQFNATVDYNTGVALGNMAIAILGTVSDVRLKTNIVKHKTFDNGLGWYSWDWTEEAKGLGYFLKHKEGFIAQEVKEIYPDTVYEKDNGILTILYNDVLRRTTNG